MEYESYKKLQVEGSGLSYGSRWGDQMEEAILSYLKDVPKDSFIIDIGCGEGRGLIALQKLGFTNLTGVDISEEKIKKLWDAKILGLDCDFHSLKFLKDKQFDYLFCSHAIEHSMLPELVVRECLRISKNGLFIVPIDDKPQPASGKSPHTSNFSTEEEWTSLFNGICKSRYTHQSKERLGKEVWTNWYEN
jgi:ubiquinone/menaquinone biosynthesis C-methylase UbiE